MPDAVVTIATTREAVEALRGTWSRLDVADIDSDIDYYLAVATTAKQVARPYVLHIERPGCPDIVVVARLENLPVRLGLGYWTFGLTTLRAIVVMFGGVLGARSVEDEELVVSELCRCLDMGAADLILMRNVDPRCTLYAAVAASVGRLRRAHGQPVDRHWIAALPKSLEAFLSDRSAKSRSSFRREERMLRDEFGARLKLRRFRSPEEFDELCRDMQLVSSRTYQNGLGVGFSNSPVDRALVSLGLRQGTYQAWILYVDESPIAFWAGMAHRDTFYPTTPGFDPDYAHHSIGRYTMFRMIEDLAADGVVSRIDFGRGDAQYKNEYAKTTRTLTDCWLAARRPWPMFTVGALTVASTVNRQGRRWASKSSFGRNIKALWRRRLAGFERKAGAGYAHAFRRIRPPE